jgi:small subunit ribosomal protein S6
MVKLSCRSHERWRKTVPTAPPRIPRTNFTIHHSQFTLPDFPSPRSPCYIPRLRSSSESGVSFFPAPRAPARGHSPQDGETVKDYEITYIFDSALEEAVVNEKLDRFHAMISGDGSEVTAVDHWGRRQLAYSIADKDNGYYVVAHAKTEQTRLPEFERLLRLDEGLLRYLVVFNEDNLSTSPAPIVETSDEEEGGDEEE